MSQNLLGQNLTQLNAFLVEAVQIPCKALEHDLVLKVSQQCAKSGGSQLLTDDDGRGTAAFELLVQVGIVLAAGKCHDLCSHVCAQLLLGGRALNDYIAAHLVSLEANELQRNDIGALVQQLDMESNGKSVNRFGEPVNYVTGPVIFGEPGTNGQHSFYQLLHQGPDIVPLQFVGFKNSQMGSDVIIQGSTSQQKLNANVAAQIVAFACGKDDTNLNKKFEGGRPSSIIIGQQLTPASLGALLSHFENKVMFQGFAWNINSFDQEGVQLGKVLAKKVLAHDTDGALAVYSELLNI